MINNESKKQKMEKMEGVDDPCSTMKITDLNIDCLEKVFNHLGINDLFNIAELNLHLREAAKLSYRHRFRATNVFLDDITVYPRRIELNYDASYLHYGECIRSEDLRSTYKLLRYFGNSISILTFLFDSTCVERSRQRLHSAEFYENSCARLMMYINEYCFESLKEIRFEGNFGSGIEFNKALENLAKPFPNVETINMKRDFHFQKNFSALFPKMKKMVYDLSTSTSDIERIIGHYPLLKHLQVRIHWYGATSVSSEDRTEIGIKIASHLNSFIQLNPHIQTLSIPFLPNETFLDSLSENLPLLENLAFHEAPPHFYDFSGHFENLKRLKIEIPYFTAINATNKMITFGQLEVFEWGLSSIAKSQIDASINGFYEFINKNPSIVKLRIFDVYPLIMPGRVCPSRLANSLKKLREIDFSFSVQLENPIRYITEIKSLQKFTFSVKEDPKNKLKELQEILPEDWQAKIILWKSIRTEWSSITLERTIESL